MNAINTDPQLEALDEAARETRIALEIARDAVQSARDADIDGCCLHHIEQHLLNAQAALQALGAR